jgi:formamidopyrimidine-DNA glycosylase
MPELPEVETVRRMLAEHLLGRVVRHVRLSGARLRNGVPRTLARRLPGRRLEAVDRRGKYLLLRFDAGLTVLAHLGMSGRWLYYPEPPREPLPHVHVRVAFRDGSELWFQDPRRFGMVRPLTRTALERDPAISGLGPDPISDPPTGAGLARLAIGTRISVKGFLLDQRRLAGVGNIYASEILHRAAVDPRRRAGAVRPDEWVRIADQTLRVLGEAIERSGTTFSMYRTLWNEPGAYGDQLLVYDRAGQPCRTCETPIRRIVQGARATFFCPRCQGRRTVAAEESSARTRSGIARRARRP